MGLLDSVLGSAMGALQGEGQRAGRSGAVLGIYGAESGGVG